MAEGSDAETSRQDFVRRIVAEDCASGTWGGAVRTRFPPEPNGYLHIGHAKSICLNFGIAAEFGGSCHLRFDDTNPSREEEAYIRAIREDVRWLGFVWDGEARFASDYFERMYDWAEQLVEQGDAYVDDQAVAEIRAQRGSLTVPGRASPYRERSPAENLDLLRRMRAGEFGDGDKVLRARIDMAAPNMNLRDPIMYRILHQPHHNTGGAWCIYPMYDWAHGLEDSIEGITHSICTLEFEDHRPLYDWFLDRLGVHHPQQIEFARLNLTHTVMSKRRLLELVQDGLVEGWDDPRLPTISGMRRRGYPPAAIRAFCAHIGVKKQNATTEIELLESFVRDELNRSAPRRMAVLDPLKLVITNYPAGEEEWLDAVNNPEDPAAGTRRVPFGRELLIEREDFLEDPPKKFFRLAPGREVRLRYAYFVTCQEVIKDADGNIRELRCTYDPATRGGDAPDGRKVKATLHWVAAAHAVPATVNLYDRLFTVPDPGAEGDWRDDLNPASLDRLTNCRLEPVLAELAPGERCQFERLGYFVVDPDTVPAAPVFNRIVALRDAWAKAKRRG